MSSIAVAAAVTYYHSNDISEPTNHDRWPSEVCDSPWHAKSELLWALLQLSIILRAKPLDEGRKNSQYNYGINCNQTMLVQSDSTYVLSFKSAHMAPQTVSLSQGAASSSFHECMIRSKSYNTHEELNPSTFISIFKQGRDCARSFSENREVIKALHTM